MKRRQVPLPNIPGETIKSYRQRLAASRRPPRWTAKRAVANTKRQVEAACERLTVVALEWGDVDQFYVDQAEELIRELKQFAERVEKEVAERLAAGEHIGI